MHWGRNPRPATLDPDRSGRRTSIHESLVRRLDAQIEALQRSSSEQNEIAWLAKYDIVGGPSAIHIDECRSDPTLESCAVRLTEVPLCVALDPERLEDPLIPTDSRSTRDSSTHR